MIRGLAVLALAGCADDIGPRLESATPSAARRRAQVVLAGERLCGPDGNCATAAGAIRIGDGASVVQATVLAYEDRRAEIVIPEIAPIGPTKLIVTVNELASNALAFEILPDDVPVASCELITAVAARRCSQPAPGSRQLVASSSDAGAEVSR